ncbi:hypothetical protein KQI69_01865 [Eubacterium sp. MSJ-13]|uniref:hypothetical protein n=1 Tax=Eubacterium sp. MSJ-13 TaxID=2841513 RepID=UPI001C1197BF|nr:hypothetical protein [Eubacterium sp. MSJ-13]MBU5477944.1 hypothetical protein [Eubacterium sp. MSJ-13]
MNVNGLGCEFSNLKRIFQKREQKGLCKETANFQVDNAINDSYNTTYLLKMGGLVSRALSDGANVTVYKSDSYTDENPILRIVTTASDGSETEQLVDPRMVDISNATENEMLALNAYLVEKGKLDDSVYTSSVLSGTNLAKVDLSSASNIKKNFFDNIKQVMEMQYNANNLLGYIECGKVLNAYNSFMDIV